MGIAKLVNNMFDFFRNPQMKWTTEHDVMLGREVLFLSCGNTRVAANVSTTLPKSSTSYKIFTLM